MEIGEFVSLVEEDAYQLVFERSFGHRGVVDRVKLRLVGVDDGILGRLGDYVVL